MTMTCESCRPRLVDHHYRELALDDARETAEHLAGCAACALEYCRLSAVLAGFRSLELDAPRPEVHRALRAKISAAFRPTLARRLSREASRVLGARVPLYQAALALLLFIFVWTLLLGAPPRGEGPGAATVLERFDAVRVDLFDNQVL